MRQTLLINNKMIKIQIRREIQKMILTLYNRFNNYNYKRILVISNLLNKFYQASWKNAFPMDLAYI